MLEEDGDEFHRKPGKMSVEDERAEADRFFVTFIYLLMLSLTFFACCCVCCVCFKKCKGSMNLRLLPANLNSLSPTPREQESRAGSLPQVNQAFVGPEQQSHGNHIEQSEHLQGTTQGNMKSDNITIMNRSPLFSFGNHSKNFPPQAVKYNSPTLATIIESKPSNDCSPSGSEIPPEVPKTSPPSSELLTVPTTLSASQYHTDPTGNSSNLSDAVISVLDRPPPSCCYPHYLQSVARPCCTESPLPVQRRPDSHTNLGQPESYTTGLLPDSHRPHNKNFQSFLNSQIHQTPDLPEMNPPPFQRTSVTLEQQSNLSHPTSLESAGNIQTSETTQLFSQEKKKELLEKSQIAQCSEMVNGSQSINEPEIPQSTSAASIKNNFELSDSLNSGYGDSSLFPLGTSRLQHYRGYNISPNDINSNDSDSIDRRRYCTHCHLCTLLCECSSTDENDTPKTPKDK